MTEKPILFSGEMVRAIMREQNPKTQTRRVCKPQPTDRYESVAGNRVFHLDGLKKRQAFVGSESKIAEELLALCPYSVGMKLWVRETFLYRANKTAVIYRADLSAFDAAGIAGLYGGWKPSILMRRQFSRLTLEVLSVRVERVTEISHRDALAEGVDYDVSKPDGAPVSRYRALWDSLNRKRGYGWSANPFVWVIEFRKLSSGDNHPALTKA